MPGRRSFDLIRDEVADDGSRSQRQVEDDRIKALTAEYKAALKRGASDRELRDLLEVSRRALYEIKAKLEADIGKHRREVPLSVFNQDILEQFIEKKIKVKTANKHGSIKSDIGHAKKCIRLLGTNSIKTVDLDIIQAIMDASKSEGENKHLIQVYRRLLKFVGRYEEADRLRRKRFQEYKPSYVTKQQVEILIKNVPERTLQKHPVLPELIRIVFNLGTRISEALALEKTDVKKAEGHVVIVIDKQWVRREYEGQPAHERLRETKNRTKRVVLPIDTEATLESLRRWLKACPTHADRESYRDALDWYIRTYCKKLFNKDVDDKESEDFFDLDSLPELENDRKYKAAHMLRAGHAVHMMSVTGDNSAFVAKQMGDSEDVVRKHYSGRTNKPTSIAEVAKIMKAK